jgi:hypothetical protein
MSTNKRTPLQQEVVEALLETKAINLEAAASVMARFGERALLNGESLAQIINHNAVWNCGYPGPVPDFGGVISRELAD